MTNEFDMWIKQRKVRDPSNGATATANAVFLLQHHTGNGKPSSVVIAARKHVAMAADVRPEPMSMPLHPEGSANATSHHCGSQVSGSRWNKAAATQ